MDLQAILRTVESKSKGMRSNLRDLVCQESPSEDRLAVNAASAMVEHLARNLGARIKRNKQKNFGDVLELHFGPLRSSRMPSSALKNQNTVWPIATLKTTRGRT